MIIKNVTIYTPQCTFEKGDIYIDNGLFVSDIPLSSEVIDGKGCYAIPGLTDLHFHGCMGYDFCDGTAEAISAITRYQASCGVTSIAPATMTLSKDKLSGIFKAAADWPNKEGACLAGINMEGPFICKAKKGAQNEKYIAEPDVRFFRDMQELSDGMIKLVALAPEVPGAQAFIEELKDEVIISVAHTTADYETAKAAFQNGARQVTHLYNAMPPLSHREPGVIGAAAEQDHVNAELICDGIHIHPAVVRATFKLFGDDRIILISDSMMATGMEDGEYALGGQPVKVRGNLATLHDGTIAGSATNLLDCMRTAVLRMDIPLESAVKCAAVNPAKALGIYDRFGSIETGKAANLVLLNQDLDLMHVILNGSVYR